MSKQDFGWCCVVLGVGILGFCVGLYVGISGHGVFKDDYWQREAVKHGAAEYDSETGNWKWKDTAKEND